MSKIYAASILLFLLLSHPAQRLAFETDQYNLPTTPLADIGDELHEYTLENIQRAIGKINAEIVTKQTCIDRTTDRLPYCRNVAADRKRLEYLRSEAAVAREIFGRLGYGIIAFARAGNWINSHKFRAQPARFKTSFANSIFVSIPTDYFTISPTVNVYGVQFGTDKIAHFFQQGYQYYRIHERETAKGAREPNATQKAVAWGRMTENTYYGTLVGGVFSNADLYANYAGMRFFEGLAKAVKIGNFTRPATLVLKNGVWELNVPGVSNENLLRPFISEHLNEALNPSLYIPGLRSSIRGIVRRQSCPQWRTLLPARTREDFQSVTDSLSLWNGENYGHKESKKFVTIANTCFADSAADFDKP